MKQLLHCLTVLLTGFNAQVKMYAAYALTITSKIMEIIDHPTIEGIVAAVSPEILQVLPGLKDVVAKAMIALQIDNVKSDWTFEEAAARFKDFLNTLSKDGRKACIFKLAQLIVKFLDGEKLPEHRYEQLVSTLLTRAKISNDGQAHS